MAVLAMSMHALFSSGANFSVSKIIPTLFRLAAGTCFHSSRTLLAQLKVGFEINLAGADHSNPPFRFPFWHHAWNLPFFSLSGVLLLIC